MGNTSPVSVVLLGFGTVFVGLICLIFITKLMSVVIKTFDKKKTAEPEKAAAPVAPVAAEIADRGAFVAAVASCIATVMGTDVSGLKILSIKKAN